MYRSVVLAATLCCASALFAQKPDEVCPRPAAGSMVEEPPTLHSVNGTLEAELTARNAGEPDGSVRYCFTDAAGQENPTLRVRPGDTVVLKLANALRDTHPGTRTHTMPMPAAPSASGCNATGMGPLSTNLHFHGLTIPATCHADEVLHTAVQPGGPAFEYRFRIPDDEPPGLYWYHPHIHGFGKEAMLGGASGAIIVEGVAREDAAAANLPERTFILRDRDLLNPNSAPSKSEPVVPKFMVDHDGDAANNGTGYGKPAKDLTINGIPVPYPDYPPATIRMRAGETQLWRVLNASAITYLDLQVRASHATAKLGLISLDGVPKRNDGTKDSEIAWQTHLGLPPGARAEFLITAPSPGETALLVTRTVDTGPGGENDPNRTLARIVTAANAPEPPFRTATLSELRPAPALPWLGDVAPVRIRHLYFSEKLADPNDPTSAVEFYLTPEGETPKMYAMGDKPNIVAEQGTVEDWIIENRSAELHDFHIHQLHFLLMEYMGRPVGEDFLRDTVNVPYASQKLLSYPSIRVRMDFRGSNTVGIFPYHCHLLEHEDRGMMGTIQVVPAGTLAATSMK